jgi:hypothetical protein
MSNKSILFGLIRGKVTAARQTTGCHKDKDAVPVGWQLEEGPVNGVRGENLTEADFYRALASCRT